MSNQGYYTKYPKKSMSVHFMPSLADKIYVSSLLLNTAPQESGYSLTPETLKPCVAMLNGLAPFIVYQMTVVLRNKR